MHPDQRSIPYDLCYAILRRCGWTELLAASSCDHQFQTLVRRILTHRIRSILLLFMSEENLPHFWTFMKTSKSCIMGGVAVCAMMGSEHNSFHSETAPVQLDIIVPSNVTNSSTATRFDHFLCAMNYEIVVPHAESGPYATCTTNVQIYRHPVIINF